MSLGKMFLSATLAENSVASLLQQGAIDHLFRANEIEPYTFVRDFVRKHQSLPKPATIKAHTGEELTAHSEPASYYLDLLRDRHVELTLKSAMKAAGTHLGLTNKDPKKALELVTEAVMGLTTQKYGMQLVDFRNAYEPIIGDYVAKYTNADNYGLHLGWPTFDQMSGGLGRGDLVSMVGRPARGKTFKMLKAARHGWNLEGQLMMAKAEADEDMPAPEQSRLFVSMEMEVLPIQKRLSAMQASVAMDHVKHTTLSTLGMSKLKGALTTIRDYGAPFWIVDGNLMATVEDVWMLARQLKPGAIFIDGAYLMKHPTEKDRFKRVAENCDLIKTMLCPLAPTVCSWQFAKPGKQSKKAKTQQDMDDIGNTDAIAQHSSIILGLLQDESVETLMRRLVRILKGRHGETGQFEINWNFQAMDFDEYVEPALSELSYV